MTNDVLRFVPVPSHVIYDPEISQDERAVLLIIAAESSGNGCDKGDATLAAKIGMTLGKFKKVLKDLTKKERIVVDELNGRHLFVSTGSHGVVHVDTTSVAPKNIFENRDNLVVDDAAINHLISTFIKLKINDGVVRKMGEKKFYANPWNRKGGRFLHACYGTEKVKEVMEKVAPHVKEKYCPQVKSLWTLYEKWDRVQYFLGNAGNGRITTIR